MTTRVPAFLLEDPALQAVIRAITAGDRRIYLVGGAVRNALLGQPVSDVDLATNARPDEVIALSGKAGLKPIPTGLDHGTITVVSDGRGFEVTTFRRDVETDGRRAVVAFSDDLAQDAARRDFTMNALYADPTGQVIDPVGGLPDLAARRLRFVGDPATRIREDYLRILRFFRFLAWYGRDVQPDALEACAALAPGLQRIARERILSELTRLLDAPDPAQAALLMKETGVLAQVLPEARVDLLPDLIAAEAAHGAAPGWRRRVMIIGGPETLAHLPLSRADARHLSRLATAMDWSLDEAAYRLGTAPARDLALLRLARGETLPPDWDARIDRGAAAKLPVAAADLKGQLEGPELGRALKAAETRWIAEGFSTPRAELIRTAHDAGKEAL